MIFKARMNLYTLLLCGAVLLSDAARAPNPKRPRKEKLPVKLYRGFFQRFTPWLIRESPSFDAKVIAKLRSSPKILATESNEESGMWLKLYGTPGYVKKVYEGHTGWIEGSLGWRNPEADQVIRERIRHNIIEILKEYEVATTLTPAQLKYHSRRYEVSWYMEIAESRDMYLDYLKLKSFMLLEQSEKEELFKKIQGKRYQRLLKEQEEAEMKPRRQLQLLEKEFKEFKQQQDFKQQQLQGQVTMLRATIHQLQQQLSHLSGVVDLATLQQL